MEKGASSLITFVIDDYDTDPPDKPVDAALALIRSGEHSNTSLLKQRPHPPSSSSSRGGKLLSSAIEKIKRRILITSTISKHKKDEGYFALLSERSHQR